MRAQQRSRSNEDLEGTECSNSYYTSGYSLLLVATLLMQESAQFSRAMEHCIRSICGQQLFRSLRAQKHISDQMSIFKNHSA